MGYSFQKSHISINLAKDLPSEIEGKYKASLNKLENYYSPYIARKCKGDGEKRVVILAKDLNENWHQIVKIWSEDRSSALRFAFQMLKGNTYENIQI